MSSPVTSSTMPTHPESIRRLTDNLEDYRKTAPNILVAFLSLQSIIGSTTLMVTTLTLMLYTISLHIAAVADASRQLRVIFAVLHIVPAVGIFIVTSVQLALVANSLTVAVFIIVLCFLPAIMIIFHYFYMAIFGVSVPCGRS